MNRLAGTTTEAYARCDWSVFFFNLAPAIAFPAGDRELIPLERAPFGLLVSGIQDKVRRAGAVRPRGAATACRTTWPTVPGRSATPRPGARPAGAAAPRARGGEGSRCASHPLRG